MKSKSKWAIGSDNAAHEKWGVRELEDDEITTRRWIIPPTAELDGEDASRIVSSHNAATERREGGDMVYVESITNQDMMPVIRMTLGNETGTFDYRQAMGHIVKLHEAVEAAISDATLARFVRENLISQTEKPDEAERLTSQMLREFRKHRVDIGQVLDEKLK